MKWCSSPNAVTDSDGECVVATQSCDHNHTAITTTGSCPNDAPSTKPTCSLCTLDGYAWCQDTSVDWDEYSGSCVSTSSQDGSSDDSHVPSTPTCPSPSRSITRLSECGSFSAAMNGGGRGWRRHGWKGWAFIIPCLVCLCITCCVRRRCKRRCRERCQQRKCRWQQRCQQQSLPSSDANASASSPSNGGCGGGCGSYPGAASLAVANAVPPSSTVPIVVATPTTAGTAPLLYSHNPQPTYVVPASISAGAGAVEVEMRPLASSTAVMYPTVNGNGYSRLTQSE